MMTKECGFSGAKKREKAALVTQATGFLNTLFTHGSKRWFGLLFAMVGLAVPGQAQAGTWTQVANVPPHAVGLMLLLPDGTVMASGAAPLESNAWYKLTPDSTGSYVNGTWTTLASMHDTRLYFSSQILKDGRVFVAGGEYGTGAATAEIYDPQTDVWTQIPVPTSILDPSQASPAINGNQMFSDSASKLLPDGSVLIAPVGPRTYGGCVIYNPTTNTWSDGPKYVRGGYQDEASWVQLPDNSILTIDPFGKNTERYIPSRNVWLNDSPTPNKLYDTYFGEMGAAFLLPNGKAFYLGSTGQTAIYTPTGNDNPGSWIAGPVIPNGQGCPDAPAAMMPNGKILCVVSPAPTSTNPATPTSFYEYDYIANSFTQVTAPGGGDTIATVSYGTTMLDLPDGTILFSRVNKKLFTYTPTGSPLAAGKPAVTGITANGDGSFHLTGTLLNGISEGAAYGDDWQMNTNYPIVRLKSGTSVYYARTYNWSSTSIMTGATPSTTEFVLPTGLPAGSYTLEVIANGISSDPIVFTPTVTPSAGANGSITPNTPQTVIIGDSVSFTATPNSQYVVDQWYVNGVSVQNGGTAFTLNNVTADTTVLVTFKNTYVVTPSAAANGSISPNTPQTVGSGGSVTFTATPAATFAVYKWLVSGTLVQVGGSSFTLSNVTANKTVQVTFKGATKGDFNFDGRTDLVLVNPATRQTSISYLNGTTSAGIVNGPVLSPGWQIIDVGDFDRDGNQDYVVFNAATRQTAIWYLNGVTYVHGSFGPTLPAGYVLAAVADFNGDGKLDFVLVNHATGQTLVWYLNNSVFVSSATGPTLPAGYVLAGVADFDGDAKPDFVLFNPVTHATKIWYLNGATFKSTVNGPTIHTGYTLIGVSDLNNDGKPDFLLLNTATNVTAFWYMKNAVQAGTVVGPTLPAGSVLPTSTLMPTPLTGDINQDGQPDLTLFKSSTRATQVTYLNGNTANGTALGPVVTSGYKLVDVADFDGDGNLDFLILNPTSRQTAIWYLNGVTLQHSSLGPVLPAGYDLITAADMNGDGSPDLVMVNHTSRQVLIWYMNNNAHTTSALGPVIASGYTLVGVADFDGDANPDLALFNPTTRATAIWYLTGAAFRSSAYGPTITAGYTLAGIADLNADGRPDFILVNTASNATAFWYMYNSTFIGPVFGPTLPAGWSLVAP